MKLKRPNLSSPCFTLRRLVVLFVFISLETIRAQTVVLHLRNGDQITGIVVSEDTNQVMLSSALIKEIVVPIAAIERREIIPAETPSAKPPPATVKPVTPQPTASLPVMIYTYAVAPYEDWHQQAWSAGFVLLTLVLAINVIARTVLAKNRHVAR